MTRIAVLVILALAFVSTAGADSVGVRQAITVNTTSTTNSILTDADPHRWHPVGVELVLPDKGTWGFSYQVVAYADRIDANGVADDPGDIALGMTLATSQSKATHKTLTSNAQMGTGKAGSAVAVAVTFAKRDRLITVNKPTTFYLLVTAHDADYDNDVTHVGVRGDIVPIVLEATRVS
jgi:hypothetical protein